MKVLAFFFFATLAFPASRLQAQWKQAEGPFGGIVMTLHSRGTALFAGTDGGGVYTTTDRGMTWTSMNDGLPPNQTVEALAANESLLFAGTRCGVFRSELHGSPWTDVNNGLSHPHILSLTFGATPPADQALYAGTAGLGVYRSTDLGETWAPSNSGLPEFAFVHALLADDSLLLAGTHAGVFRSTNDGDLWEPASGELAGLFITSLASVQSGAGLHLFAGTYIGVFASTDGGQTWSSANTGLRDTVVIGLQAHGQNLFALTPLGPFVSTDGGTNWSGINSWSGESLVLSLEVLAGESTEDLFAGTVGRGIFRSSDRGVTWIETNTGLTATHVQALEVSPDGTLLAGTTSGLFRSSDNGGSWGRVESELAAVNVASILRTPVGLYAATFARGTFFSADNGDTWTAMNEGLTNALVNALAYDTHGLFAGTYGGGVFRSTNHGISWNEANGGLADPLVLALATDGDRIFAGTDYYGGVFVSTDGGGQWTYTGLSPEYVSALVVSDSVLLAGTSDGIFVSWDHGSQWAKTFEASEGLGLALNGRNTFAGTRSGIFHSTDYGRTWRDISSGLLTTAVRSMVVDSEKLFAGTLGGGVWYRPLSEIITSVQRPPEGRIPEGFGLAQNYPNPFNPSTTISYRLDVPSQVRLEVFNMFGQRVALLVDGEKEDGIHEVRWMADVPSGTYFYRLTANPLKPELSGFEMVRKMVLVK